MTVLGKSKVGVEAESLNDAPARIHAMAESAGAAPERIDATTESPTAPARIDAMIESAGVALERTNATVDLSAAEPARTNAIIESSTAAPTRIEDSGTGLAGPQRYKVQFTASEEYVALVEEAKALLAHASPDADIAEIHLRAVRTLVAELKKRKYAHSERRVVTASSSAKMPDNTRSVTNAEAPGRSPRQRGAVEPSPQHDATEPPRQRDAAPSSHQPGRHVLAAVRREVFARDGQRCAYVDARGARCRETHRLEIHHHEPFARGGAMTRENLSLYCSAHNALAAERDFGREFSRVRRESHAHFTERALARSNVPIGSPEPVAPNRPNPREG